MQKPEVTTPQAGRATPPVSPPLRASSSPPSSLRRSVASATDYRLLTTDFSAAFTLVELLVAIGIIAALIGFLLPAVMRARYNSNRVRIGLDLQAVATALEAYKHDFNDYPRLSNFPLPDGTPYNPIANAHNVYGAQLLCWALVAPAPQHSATGLANDATTQDHDGADGFGFRLRTTGQGQVYGPYLKPDAFQIGQRAADNTFQAPALSDNTDQIFDHQNHLILYYTANLNRTNVDLAQRYVTPDGAALFGGAPTPQLYDPRQNPLLATADMQRLMGDTNSNGLIDGNETALCTGSYILWSPGPDGIFGTDDDVTNFERSPTK